MLQEGVTCLLNGHSEAFVHNIRYRDDHALIHEIESKSPNVVIVTEPEVAVDVILSIPSLKELAPRVIVLSLDGNTINVFDHAKTRDAEAKYQR